MTNPFKTDEFNALKKEWDKRLKEEGFRDAEDKGGKLSVWHATRFPIRQYPYRQEYFYFAEHFLHAHRFKSAAEETIWALHVDGKSIEAIWRSLQGSKFYTGRVKVFRTIKRLQEMLKNFIEEQAQWTNLASSQDKNSSPIG